MSDTVSQDSQNTAVLMFVLSIFFWIISPLIFFLIKKDDQFVHANAKELLNFEISLIAYYFVLLFIPIIGWFLMVPLGIVAFILLIKGILTVRNGQNVSFPFIFRLLK
jgi:uncharacterized Tic20 family protein